jgi:hypothetical protein
LKLTEMIESKEKMREVFKKFDIDGDGFISAEEIEEVFVNQEPGMLKRMISEADHNKDGRISFPEWCRAMGVVHDEQMNEIFEVKRFNTNRKFKPSRTNTMKIPATPKGTSD